MGLRAYEDAVGRIGATSAPSLATAWPACSLCGARPHDSERGAPVVAESIDPHVARAAVVRKNPRGKVPMPSTAVDLDDWTIAVCHSRAH